MQKFNPVVKVKSFAQEHSIKLSDKAIVKTEQANSFFTNIADDFLFIVRIIKETFSRNFEFKEFLYQCFQIGYKSLPLITSTKPIIVPVIVIRGSDLYPI